MYKKKNRITEKKKKEKAPKIHHQLIKTSKQKKKSKTTPNSTTTILLAQFISLKKSSIILECYYIFPLVHTQKWKIIISTINPRKKNYYKNIQPLSLITWVSSTIYHCTSLYLSLLCKTTPSPEKKIIKNIRSSWKQNKTKKNNINNNCRV